MNSPSTENPAAALSGQSGVSVTLTGEEVLQIAGRYSVDVHEVLASLTRLRKSARKLLGATNELYVEHYPKAFEDAWEFNRPARLKKWRGHLHAAKVKVRERIENGQGMIVGRSNYRKRYRAAIGYHSLSFEATERNARDAFASTRIQITPAISIFLPNFEENNRHTAYAYSFSDPEASDPRRYTRLLSYHEAFFKNWGLAFPGEEARVVNVFFEKPFEVENQSLTYEAITKLEALVADYDVLRALVEFAQTHTSQSYALPIEYIKAIKDQTLRNTIVAMHAEEKQQLASLRVLHRFLTWITSKPTSEWATESEAMAFAADLAKLIKKSTRPT